MYYLRVTLRFVSTLLVQRFGFCDFSKYFLQAALYASRMRLVSASDRSRTLFGFDSYEIRMRFVFDSDRVRTRFGCYWGSASRRASGNFRTPNCTNLNTMCIRTFQNDSEPCWHHCWPWGWKLTRSDATNRSDCRLSHNPNRVL
jgi:hypothetical protein